MTKTFLESLNHKEIKSTTHPQAVKYLKNFKKQKVELGELLFKMYNTTVFEGCLPADMKLIWSKTLTKTAGRCRCKIKKKGTETERFCEIELSAKVLTSADRLRDTLIHEL